MFNLKPETENYFSVEINISSLYGDKKEEVSKFYKRFDEFMESSDENPFVYRRTKKGIKYNSQILLPTKSDGRKPLLIILGNPAPQSVRRKIIFAYEGKNQIHRMWKVLFDTELLRFSDILDDYLNLEKNELLKSLQYNSPFLFGFYSFFSAPSPSSEKKWSGVAGIRRLFGATAFSLISKFEQKRFKNMTSNFLKDGGTVLCFQKDSYELITAIYLKDLVNLQSDVVGITSETPKIISMPPTRLLYSNKSKDILRSLISKSNK